MLLEFDNDLIIQECCKTQFAEIDSHIKIIQLLRVIEPYFFRLNVNAEGEYWNSNNIILLKKHIDLNFKGIEDAKIKDINLTDPFRINGRIIDLMSNQK